MVIILLNDLLSHFNSCNIFIIKKILAGFTFLFIVGTVNAQVEANAGEDVQAGLCYIHTLQGDASTGTALTAKWRMIEGPQIVNMAGTTQINALFQAYKGGVYFFELTVTDENNISDKDTVMFTIMDLKAEVMDDITIGGCQTIVLDATKNSTLGDGYTFEWYDDRKLSDNSASPTFTPGFTDFNKTIKFYFTVRDTFGCEAVDEFDITVKDIPVAAINNNVTEVGCDTLEINGSWSDGYNISYSWYPQESIKSLEGTPEVVHVSNEIPELKLVVEDALGCKDSATYDLGDNQFKVNAGDDIFTGNCIGVNVIGEVVGSADIQWLPQDLISTTRRPAQVRISAAAIRGAMGSDTTAVIPIILQAKKDNGCIRRDTMNITATNTAYYYSAGPDVNSGVCGTQLNSFVETALFNSFYWSGSVFSWSENRDQVNKEQPEIYFGNSLAQTTQSVRLNVIDIYGCSKSDVARIFVDRSPEINIPVQNYTANGCKPVQISIGSANIDSFSWTPTAGIIDPHVEDPVYFGSTTQNLLVRGYDKWGCYAEGSIKINSEPLMADAGTDKKTTQFSPVVLGSGQSIDGYNVLWSLAEANSEISLENENEAFCTFTSNVMGTFKVYYLLSDNESCIVKDSILVRVDFGNRLPVITSIGADTLLVHKDDEITFSFSYSSPDDDPHSVQWLIEGDTYNFATIKVPVTSEGWAVASVSDPYATVKDSVYYRIKPREQVVIHNLVKLPDSVYVNDEFTVEVDATSEYTNDLSYRWTFLGEIYDDISFTANLLNESWAVVEVTDGYTSVKDSIFIGFTQEQPVETFNILIEPADSVNKGSDFSVQVIPGGSETYRLNYKIWYNGDEVNMNYAEFIAEVSSYIVAEVYNSQYAKKDSVWLSVMGKENTPQLGENNINAFSPNGDEFNQFFEIANIEYYPKNELSIFDKTGNLVYFTKNYKNNWSGKRNSGVGIGKDLPSGTYFYLLKAEGKDIVSGFVIIRR